MKVLRDVYVAREEAWRESSENEQTYRHQISDLLLEIITYRHNLECRSRELENFHQDLVVQFLFNFFSAIHRYNSYDCDFKAFFCF